MSHCVQCGIVGRRAHSRETSVSGPALSHPTGELNQGRPQFHPCLWHKPSNLSFSKKTLKMWQNENGIGFVFLNWGRPRWTVVELNFWFLREHLLVLCKGPDGINVLDFPGGASHTSSALQVLLKRSHKEDLNKSSWLYSNKTWLMDVVRFMKFISHYSQSDILLIFSFFSSTMEKIEKPFLACRPCKNRPGKILAPCWPLLYIYYCHVKVESLWHSGKNFIPLVWSESLSWLCSEPCNSE